MIVLWTRSVGTYFCEFLENKNLVLFFSISDKVSYAPKESVFSYAKKTAVSLDIDLRCWPPCSLNYMLALLLIQFSVLGVSWFWHFHPPFPSTEAHFPIPHISTVILVRSVFCVYILITEIFFLYDLFLGIYVFVLCLLPVQPQALC